MTDSPWTWPVRAVTSIGWYLREFVVSNAAVTRDILTRTHHASPVVVAHDSRCRREWEVSLLGILVTLTPGTLTLATEEVTGEDVTGEPTGASGHRRDTRRFRLWVHVMFADSPETARTQVAELETRLLAAVRPRGAGPAPQEAP